MTNRLETNMNTLLRNALCPLLALLATAGFACKDIKTANLPPKAVIEAKIDGKVIDPKVSIDYAGEPIEVVLSAAMSSDEDGTIEAYKWRRTDVPAGGDAGATAGIGDPKAGEKTTVTLEEGTYRFTLYITDNDGALGAPASVSLTVETPVLFEGDPECLTTYEGANEDCTACVCAEQGELGGCYDLYDNCFNNADTMFSDLCVGVLNCGVDHACLGAACYAADKCMVEIDAASQYMGGTIASCNDATLMPEDNPCRAITVFSNCINTEMVMMPDRPGCGKYCAAM